MSSLIELEWAWGRSHFAVYLGELEVGTDTKIMNNHDHFVGPPLLNPLPVKGGLERAEWWRDGREI